MFLIILFMTLKVDNGYMITSANRVFFFHNPSISHKKNKEKGNRVFINIDVAESL